MRTRKVIASLLAAAAILSMLLVGVFSAAAADTTPASADTVETLNGTLIRSSVADPWLFMDGGYYYLTMTGTKRIAMIKSETLDGLDASEQTLSSNIVYDSAGDPTVTELFGEGAILSGTWSPEVYYFSEEQYPGYAGWYMFLALRKDTGDSSAIQMVVLKSTTDDPKGPYGHPVTGKVNHSQPVLDKNGNVYSDWGCGMSCVTIAEGEFKGLYTMWVTEVGRGEGLGNFYQKIMINKMSNPWTMARDPGVITTPTQDWEYAGSSSTHPRVVEGATAVYGTHGEVFLTYSGSGYWSNYGLGQLTWTGGDPLLTSSWHKLDTSINPIFSAVNADNVRGAGHASFLRDAQGNGFLCYHAYAYTDGTKDSGRSAYIEPYYIDYTEWNGVSYGVIHCGIDDNRIPANTATTVTFASEGEALGVPNITASADRHVTLNLNAAAAEGYAIYRSTDGETFSYLADSKTSEYTDTDTVVGTTYYYRAYSYRNEELSAVSETVSVTVPGLDKNAIRPSFTATQTADTITLNWEKVENIDGYKIYRKAPGETAYTEWKTLYDPDATSFDDTGLESGVAYGYLMHSFYKDATGKAYFSTSSGGKLVYTKPAAPKGISEYDKSGGVKITITDPVACTGYAYARSDDGGHSFNVIYTGPEAYYIDNDVEVGKTYYYRVYAYAGDISVRSASTGAGSIEAWPEAPVIDSIECTDKGVTLTWDAVEGATGYKVFRKLPNSSSWDQLEKLSDLTYTDATAETGQTYVYAVQAYQTIGTNHYYSKLADVTKTITVDVDCVHNWVGGVCSKCGVTCRHPQHDPATCVCTGCGTASEHTWVNGICYGCDTVCTHTWADGTCTNCGKTCNHTWSNGACTVCGLECEHTNWTNGICNVCRFVCEHNWSDNLCTVCGMNAEDHANKDSLYTNKYVSIDADGNYVLTLEAYGKGDITTMSYAKPADIVLVLDVSASMYTPVGSSSHVVTYADETESTTVDYTGAGTPANGKSMIASEMDITGYIIPNADLDTALGTHMGYYIAQSETTQDWWLLKYFVNEDFSPNYKNYTGWGAYRLNRIKGTGDVIYQSTINPDNSDNKTVFGASLPDRMTVWKTQYGALYDSVGAFLADLRSSNVNHRVSITTFCGVNNAYTGVYNSTMTKSFWSLYGGSGSDGNATYAYTQDEVVANNWAFLQGSWKTVTDPADYADLEASLNAIVTNGAYTCPAAGIALANTVLDTVYTGNEENRDRVVLLFTDGAPNLDLKRGHGGGSARNDAVVQAYTAKQTYGATVFSLYTSTVSDTNNANRTFLRLASSMYPNAHHYAIQDAEGKWQPDSSAWGSRVTDKEYCFQATDEESLNMAFTNISTSISQPATDLTEHSVLRDVLSDYFDLRDATGDQAVTVGDILVFTAPYLGNGEFGTPMRQTKLTVELVSTNATEENPDGDGRIDSISVSGFSYVQNYVHDATTEQAAGGSMLIVKIPIQVREGFWGGNGVPTNEDSSSGLYAKDALGMAKVTVLPVPELNVPVAPKLHTKDVSVYYGGTATQNDVFTGISLGTTAINYENDGTCAPAEDWMDDYATMSWAGYGHSISGKEAASYPYSVTVTPSTPGTDMNIPVLAADEIKLPTSPMTEVAAVVEKTESAAGTVHILTPYITFRDSSILPGTVPGAYDATNLAQDAMLWKNELGEEAGAEDTVLGQAPMLTLSYTPAAAAFTADTAVNATVTSSNGDEDITSVTTFLWVCDQLRHDAAQNIETHLGSADSPEFWIHVSGDSIVIDFGLCVQISALGGGDVPEGFRMVGVGKDSPGTANSAENLLKETQSDTSFGFVKIDNGKLLYTPNTMEMTGCDEFYYAAQYDGQYLYWKVTVIPAANIYYEDDFAGRITYSVYEKTSGGWSLSSDQKWVVEGAANSGVQAEERPGSGGNYGYDDAYTNCIYYSMGTAHQITVDPSTYGLATFCFNGTGLDIIGRTTSDSGFITVKIYKAGETVPMHTLSVDTYYSQEDGMYQIPVMRLKDLPYGKYTVEVKAAYNKWLDHKDADEQNGSYAFYLDAIRVYDPTGVVSGETDNDIVSGAYGADGEHYPIYQELRDMLIMSDSFGELTVESEGGTNQVPGTVFIDSDQEVTIANYRNEGPNNEVYLKPGQSVAFNLPNVFVNEQGAMIAPVDVQVGLKAVSGAAGFEIYTPGVETTTMENGSSVTTTYSSVKMNTTSGELTTATEMYYSVMSLYGDTVIITNSGTEGILSITNLKFTFDEKAQIGETATVMVTSISESDAVDAIRCLSNYNEFIIVEKVDNETFAPDITVPEKNDGVMTEINPGAVPENGGSAAPGVNENSTPEHSGALPGDAGTTAPEHNSAAPGANGSTMPADPVDTVPKDNVNVAPGNGNTAEPENSEQEIPENDAIATPDQDPDSVPKQEDEDTEDARASDDGAWHNGVLIWVLVFSLCGIGILTYALARKFGKGRGK